MAQTERGIGITLCVWNAGDPIDREGSAILCYLYHGRIDQYSSHEGAKSWRYADILCCVVAEIYRQEIEGSVIEHVHEDIDVARLRDDARHRRAENDTDRLEEAGAHEDRDERHHRARKVVQDVVADCLGRELFGSAVQILFDGLNGVPGAVPHLSRRYLRPYSTPVFRFGIRMQESCTRNRGQHLKVLASVTASSCILLFLPACQGFA